MTWGEFVRAPVSQPSFFVVITTFSETVWTQLTVLILDYVVPWVSHSGRRQGTKDDQTDVFEVNGGHGANFDVQSSVSKWRVQAFSAFAPEKAEWCY